MNYIKDFSLFDEKSFYFNVLINSMNFYSENYSQK